MEKASRQIESQFDRLDLTGQFGELNHPHLCLNRLQESRPLVDRRSVLHHTIDHGLTVLGQVEAGGRTIGLWIGRKAGRVRSSSSRAVCTSPSLGPRDYDIEALAPSAVSASAGIKPSIFASAPCSSFSSRLFMSDTSCDVRGVDLVVLGTVPTKRMSRIW